MEENNDALLQPEQPIELNEQDVKVIMTYGTLTKAVREQLSETDRDAVIGELNMLRSLMENGSDAFRVALQLFTLEVDNTAPPFGDAFTKMPMADWEEALEIWRTGGLQ